MISACLGCGCACDDIDVVVADRRIVEARHACPLGVAWFGDGTVPVRALVAGREASVDEAIAAAARMLTRAARPLIYLAPDLSCEGQREGIALADLLRGALDSVTSSTAMPTLLAAQEAGRAGATLGEIRHRADVLVFWGVDPAARYPRYWTRYAPDPPGIHVPEGRRSRTVVAVDIGDAHGPADADLRVALATGDEVATLTALGALVRRSPPPGGRRRAGTPDTTYDVATKDVATPWVRAGELAPALLAGRYVVLVADAEPDDSTQAGDPGRAGALIALTQALNGPTRGALSTLRAGGNRSGADACATSQTGYPAAIDFARGYPRYRPHDGGAAARLQRGEVEGVLVIGSAASVPADLLTMMRAVPHAVVGPRASESVLGKGEAVVDTGVAGIHEAGMAVRMDEVPLPLGAPIGGPPGAAATIRALIERVAASA